MKDHHRTGVRGILIVVSTLGFLLLGVATRAPAADPDSAGAHSVATAALPNVLLAPEVLEHLGYEQAWAARLQPAATPQLIDGVLYVQTRRRFAQATTLHALEAKSGKELWAYPLSGPPDFPLVTDEKHVYTVAAGIMHAIVIDTGVSSMKRLLPFAPSCGPSPDKGDLWLMAWDGTLYRLSGENGEINTRVQIGVPVTVPVTVLESYVIACGEDHRLRAILSLARKELWALKLRGRVGAAPVLANGILCAGSDAFSVVGMIGDRIAWEAPLEGPVERPLYLLGEDTLLASATNDSLVALDPKDGRKLWSVPGGLWPVAVSENSTVIQVDKDGIAAVGAPDGAILWEQRADDIRSFVPNGVDPALYVVPKAGGIVAIRPAK